MWSTTSHSADDEMKAKLLQYGTYAFKDQSAHWQVLILTGIFYWTAHRKTCLTRTATLLEFGLGQGIPQVSPKIFLE